MARKKDPQEKGWTPEELEAMRERAQEARGKGRVAGEQAVLAKIAEMPEPDRTMALRLHQLVREVAPSLEPRTWYGMPAYARDGKVVCFFQSAHKFKTRYATLGFTDAANLDEGVMWPVAFALTAWNPEVEARVRELILRAIS